MRAAVVAIALLMASAARADDVSDRHIFMCLAAMGAATDSDDPRLAEDAHMGSVFWMGRIDPAMSLDRITELAAQASEAVNKNNMASTLDRCGEEINRVNDEFGEAIRRLRAEGKAR